MKSRTFEAFVSECTPPEPSEIIPGQELERLDFELYDRYEQGEFDEWAEVWDDEFLDEYIK